MCVCVCIYIYIYIYIYIHTHNKKTWLITVVIICRNPYYYLEQRWRWARVKSQTLWAPSEDQWDRLWILWDLSQIHTLIRAFKLLLSEPRMIVCSSKRERDTHTHSHSLTQRHTHTHTETHTDRDTHTHTETHTHRETHTATPPPHPKDTHTHTQLMIQSVSKIQRSLMHLNSESCSVSNKTIYSIT